MENVGTIFNVQKFSINDGPGIRTLVFFKGCPLRCLWCSNPESQSIAPQRDSEGTLYGRDETVDSLMRVIMQDEPFYEESGGGVTLSGGEPLLQIDFAIALLEALRAKGIHTAVETTGAVSRQNFSRAAELIDLFLFDVKHYDAEKHRHYTGVSNERIIENLRYVLELKKDVLVRIPVIPGVNDSLEDALGFCKLLVSMGVQHVELLPFHQFGEKKYALLEREYAFAGVPAMKEEQLSDYKKIFATHGLL